MKELNYDSIKKLMDDSFEQQKEDIFNQLAQVNMEHYADVERQIAKINKRVVGWGWFLFILVIWSIIMFGAYISYHNHYLRTGKQFRLFHSDFVEWNSALKDAQIKGYSPNIRSGKETKKWTAAQNDSIHKDNQAGILLQIERRDREYKEKYGKK